MAIGWAVALVSWVAAGRGASRGTKALQPFRHVLSFEIPERWFRGLLWGMVAAFALTFGALAILQHDALGTHAWDSGIFDQVVWNLAYGRPWAISITVQSPHFLGQHFAPLLYLLVPLYWLRPDPRWLYGLQALLLALPALPVAWYARERLKSHSLALVAAGTYLLLPGTGYVTLFDFHEIALAAPAVALAAYALMTRRNRLFVVSTVVACLAKEDVGIVTFAFGLYAMLAQRRWIFGAIVAGSSFLWLTFLVNWLIPSFNPGGPYYAAGRYSAFGNSPGEVALNVVVHPVRTFTRVFTPTRVLYLLYFLAPAAAIPLLGLEAVVLVLPSFAYLLLSNEFADFVITQHYAATISPLVALLAVEGLARPRFLTELSRRSFALGLVVSLVAAAYLFGPLPGARTFKPERFDRDAPHARLGRAIAATFPADAGIAAQDNLVPHVSRRERVYLYPDVIDWSGVRYVWLDERSSKYPLDDDPERYRRYVRGMLSDPDFELIREEDGFRVLERRDWSMPNPTDVRLGESVRLGGYDAGISLVNGQALLSLTLYWQTARKLAEDYTLFVHVVGPDGEVHGQLDVYPTTTELPTTWWEPGKWYRQRYLVPLKPGAPAGDHEVRLGLYLLRTLERLPVAAPPDRERDRAFLISVSIARN